MRFDVASESEDPALRRLLRENPVGGAIRVSLEREPNIFLAATIEGESHEVIVARDDVTGSIIGMGSRAVLSAYVNGEVRSVGYLSQLRVDRRQPALRRLLAGGYRKLRDLHGDTRVPFYYTTIVSDNRPARRILEAGLPGLPRYRPLEPFVTLIVPVTRLRRWRRSEITIERAGPDRLTDIVDCLERNAPRYQFARRWTREDLISTERARDLRVEDFFVARRAERTVGCLACWDQRRFKQSVVRGYEPWLARLRPILNLAAPWIHQPRLPPPGAAIRQAFVSHVAVDGDDPATFLALLTAAYNQAVRRQLDYLVLGFSPRHPLFQPARREFPNRRYESVLYLVYWEEDGAIAREVDGRIPHLEVATL